MKSTVLYLVSSISTRVQSFSIYSVSFLRKDELLQTFNLINFSRLVSSTTLVHAI